MHFAREKRFPRPCVCCILIADWLGNHIHAEGKQTRVIDGEKLGERERDFSFQKWAPIKRCYACAVCIVLRHFLFSNLFTFHSAPFLFFSYLYLLVLCASGVIRSQHSPNWCQTSIFLLISCFFSSWLMEISLDEIQYTHVWQENRCIRPPSPSQLQVNCQLWCSKRCWQTSSILFFRDAHGLSLQVSKRPTTTTTTTNLLITKYIFFYSYAKWPPSQLSLTCDSNNAVQ